MIHLARLLLCLLALLLVPAATSTAQTTVEFIPEEEFGEDGIRESQLLVYSTEGDAPNDISIVQDGTSVTVTDSAGVSASGCEETTETDATCPVPFVVWVGPDAGDDTVEIDSSLAAVVNGGDGDDTITFGFGRAFGEAGADVLTTTGDRGAFGLVITPGQNPDLWEAEFAPLGDGYGGIDGGEGDDELVSGEGQDVLEGREGNDTLNGGEGGDQLLGGTGSDTLQGEDGRDRLDGDSDIDGPAGDAASDTLDGGPGRDILAWADRTDPVQVDLDDNGTQDGIVGEGEDVKEIEIVITGSGDDTILGTGANETFDPGAGADAVAAGGGRDTISYRGARQGVVVLLFNSGTARVEGQPDTVHEIENIIGSRHDDKLTGNFLRNVINGAGGSDSVRGRGGRDRLDAGSGDGDVLDGGSGGDVLASLTAERSTLKGRSGDDRLDAGRGTTDVLLGGSGDDLLRAAGANGAGAVIDRDVLIGGAGNDRLTDAGGPNDTLLGGAGRDVLEALDRRRDSLHCGSDADRFQADDRDSVRACEARL
jgi:Ca2+-binding RTX toxin-like protein